MIRENMFTIWFGISLVVFLSYVIIPVPVEIILFTFVVVVLLSLFCFVERAIGFFEKVDKR